MVTVSKLHLRDKKYECISYATCDKTGECPLYKKGKCACKFNSISHDIACPSAQFHYDSCSHRRDTTKGLQWNAEVKEKFAPTAESFDYKVAETAEYIFLPMPFLTSAYNEVEGVINHHFVPKEQFDADFVQKIVEFVPIGWFVNEPIWSYQEQDVPKFIQHLKEELPDIYDAWAKKYPDTANKYPGISPVGRTAIIETLPDGCIIPHWDCTFEKNGDLLISYDYKNKPFGDNDAMCKVVLTITPKMHAKVTERMEVDENTKYLD